jgi:hypothetical protein
MEYDLPEDYYRQNGWTRLASGSGPHLGAEAGLSFDIVERTDVIPGQPEAVNGELKCYQRLKTIRRRFIWRLNPATHRFGLVTSEETGVIYGPPTEVPCPPALKQAFKDAPAPIDESGIDVCPDDDPWGTQGLEPDAFYADFFRGETWRIVQRTKTAKGQVDLVERDFLHYGEQRMGENRRCFARRRHVKARLYWTFCPKDGWHLQDMTFYVNLWGPWREIPCEDVPRETNLMPVTD